MPRYIVTEEVTWQYVYEITAKDEDDARDRYSTEGDQVRADIIDSTVAEVEEQVSDPCRCEHPLHMHQTGEGPWTGFCAWMDTDGNQCKCSQPEPPLHWHSDDPCWTNHGLGTEDN